MLWVRTLRPNLKPSILGCHSSCWYSSSSAAAAIQAETSIKQGPRFDWSRDEIQSIYDSPLLDLLFHGPVEIWEMIQMIATARIVMPNAMVRLSAGRVRFSMPEQALCFLAGANSIFSGDKLLTTPNNDYDADQLMFKMLGLIPKPPSFDDAESGSCAAVASGSG